MSFLAPWMLVAGALGAVAAVALHLLSTRRPPRAVLPTARFIPESDARAVSRTSRPTDPLLLALRVLAVLLIAAAFARPVPDAPGPSVRTVVLLDGSSGVADRAAAWAAARERVGDGGALVVFDTTARVVAADASREASSDAPPGAPRESTIDSPQPVRAARGILSAALVAGVREARAIARGADSVRLVLVSPLAEELWDAATPLARAGWPGSVEVVRIAGVSDTAARGPVDVVSSLDDDPLAPAMRALPRAAGTHAVRVVRTMPSAADSAWAREPGRVLVHWPLGGTPAPDGVTGFGLRSATLVAPLSRERATIDTTLAREDATRDSRTRPARVIARWRDGEAAAVERAHGAGCLRDVGVGLPLAGDITLRPPFVAFLAAMTEPCGGARGLPVRDSIATAFTGGSAAASARTLTVAGATDATLTAWLLGGALLALALEWLLRRRRAA